ncbi:MAG: adenosine deaminase [Candidatus Bipolaricaulota bacterium]|nr:adenosine deaminase [Candidatus Bipolaricaulota bacterium]
MDRVFIQDLPKFDLHVHLDGSLRHDTVIELSKDSPIAGAIPRLIPAKRCSLEDYLQAFLITVGVLQTKEALTRCAYELCADAAAENVIYMEIRFAPLLHLDGGLSPEEVVSAVLAGMYRAEREFGLKTGLILCGMKQEPPDKSEAVARLGTEFIDDGVVAIDLAGPEKGYPPIRHRRAIELARQAGLQVTIHAGESCCPGHIKQAIELGAARIGHGVYLYRDGKTERLVLNRGIPLELCPTSNLQISGNIEGYADHPLWRYLDEGIIVTVNTDNRLMSQTSCTNELYRLTQAVPFSKERLRTILLNSVTAAFASKDTKILLKRQVEAALGD